MKTKTTFELDSGLLKQLKTAAARGGKSVRDLLTEGALAMLEKYEAQEDRDELVRRANEARLRFTASYDGPPDLSADIDRLVYRVAERQGESRAAPPGKRRRK